MNRKYFKYLLTALLLFTIILKAQKNNKQAVMAIKNVNIITMSSDKKIIKNATLVIKDNKIFSINGVIPQSAKMIDGKGKWLIPGLIDIHVHGVADINFGASYPTEGDTFLVDNQDMMMPYVVNGVTTIFDLNSRVENFAQRNEIIKGKIIGPRMALAALINGGNGSGRIANTPSDGRQTVRIAKAEGYEFIKVYSELNVETFKAIVDEAKKQGMKVVGHIPDAFKGRTEEAFVPGFDMVAHAEELAKQSENYSDEDIQKFVRLVKDNGTWLSPTLIVIKRIEEQARSLDIIPKLEGFRYIHPLMQNKWMTSNQYHDKSSPEFIAYLDKMIAFNNRLVKAFKEAGIPIVAGTDSGCSGVVWGYSLHDEIELLVKAGLTPEEALNSSTKLSATWLGIDDKIGTVEVGKLADLVLLDANPLDDIRNTRKISDVFFNGQWVSKKKMDKMLSDLAKKNDDNKSKFDWKKRKELKNTL
ncbi:amidohydrolase family protein [Chryseobacterium sp. JM1]|uniref:amidohydrolase family protein n=1 Tax=Chryseobacterium sp. JM1 TaxID=1233950 RepID=UPI0004E71479|nr:amidohydrolase family protein [Chryseobacterium sp. JM1]KFF21541.1 amidohydrolase [Chryseobacterium sp. JM1]